MFDCLGEVWVEIGPHSQQSSASKKHHPQEPFEIHIEHLRNDVEAGANAAKGYHEMPPGPERPVYRHLFVPPHRGPGPPCFHAPSMPMLVPSVGSLRAPQSAIDKTKLCYYMCIHTG